MLRSLRAYSLALSAPPLVACGGESTPAPSGGVTLTEPLTIRTVDEDGAPVLAKRLLYQAQPADAFWLQAKSAQCSNAAAPPCSEWIITERFTTRIAVAADRTTEATGTDACIPYASAYAVLHPGTDTVPNQLVHLTLPRDATYCIDPGTGRSVINMDQAERFDASDVLAPPPPAPSGAIEVKVVNGAGVPTPATMSNWYYTPDGPDYDGEQPLVCLDQRCETWRVTDTPKRGRIYLTASYAGPLNPFLQQGWNGYGAGPFEVEVDGSGQIVPFTATLTVDTDVEGAIGGDVNQP